MNWKLCLSWAGGYAACWSAIFGAKAQAFSELLLKRPRQWELYLCIRSPGILLHLTKIEGTTMFFAKTDAKEWRGRQPELAP